MTVEQYLQATDYIDYEHPHIQQILEDLDLDGLSDVDKAVKLFYYVRDTISYSAKVSLLDPKIFRASFTLQQPTSFCIPKALALCALSRAVGIPARIHLVDFYNHRLSDKLEEIWGTKVMAGHCYTELHLNGKWIKATPSLDSGTCDRHEFVQVEFDGTSDAIIKEQDRQGRKHAEYIKDHGAYADLPLTKVMEIFDTNYGPLTPERMAQFSGNKSTDFQDP